MIRSCARSECNIFLHNNSEINRVEPRPVNFENLLTEHCTFFRKFLRLSLKLF